MNHQSKIVTAVLIFLFVGLSAFAVLTISFLQAGFSQGFVLSVAGLIIVVIASASIMAPQITGAPWVPTSQVLVSKALKMAELKPDELLYDLGSGDGRIAIAAARDFGARAVGVEIDLFRVLYSRFRIARLGLRDRVKIVRGNFFKTNLSSADVVVLYLVQHTNNLLQRKLETELTKPNCRVVSVVWKFEGWELIRADEKEMIYLYWPKSSKSTQ